MKQQLHNMQTKTCRQYADENNIITQYIDENIIIIQ